MPPQKAVPIMESLETYYREDDGIHSSVKKLSKDISRKKSIDDSFSHWDGLKFDRTFQRRESDASMLSEDTDNFIVGDRVWVGGNKPGVIAFIGETQFGPGDWAGVVLDESIGKNDGSVAGIRYFQCPPARGIFSRLTRLSRSPVDPNYFSSKLLKTPTPGTPDRNQTLTSSPTSSISSRVKLPFSYNSISNSSGGDIKVGDRVIVQSSHGSKAGVLRYYGNTEFGAGLWCGVELDDPLGKNDGSVAGIRYFECAPKFGLFVPAEKVSRSPISNKKASCVVHPGGISRQGTLDSIRTSASTINTSISSIKSNSRKPTQRSSITPARTSTINAPKSPLQEQLKEKEDYIKQLLKEKELERAEIIRAATQAEEVEKQLAAMKDEHNKTCADFELQKTNYQKTIERLEKEKVRLEYLVEEEKKKIEDLQFSYEEESITKSEIQALNEEYVEKLKTLEKVVNSQTPSLEYDGQSSGIFDSSEGGPASVPFSGNKDPTEELTNSKQLIQALTDMKNDLQNECAVLKVTIEKMKLIDKNKDEVINNMKKETSTLEKLNTENESDSELEKEVALLRDKLKHNKDEKEIIRNEVSTLKDQLIALQNLIKHKDDVLEKKKEYEYVNNDLQFELDEYKVKNEELTKKIGQLSDEILVIQNNSKNFIDICITCINQLSNDFKLENEIITNVVLGKETANSAVTVLRGKDTSLSSLLEKCPEELKDSFSELAQQIEQINNNNALLLEKIETLAEVISRKDFQIEEIAEEKEALRKEYLESVQIKTNELKNLETKYADLSLVKNNIERQLKASEENVRKIEAVCSDKESLTSEIENTRKILENKTSLCEKLQQDTNVLKEELKGKEEENKTNKESFEKEKAFLTAEIENIKKNLEAKTATCEKLQQEYTTLKEELKEKEEEKKINKEEFEKNHNNLLSETNIIRKNLKEKAEFCEKLMQDLNAMKEELKSRNEEHELSKQAFEKETEDLKLKIQEKNEKLYNEIAEKNTLKNDLVELQKLNEFTTSLNEAKNADEFENLKNKIENLVAENRSKEEKLHEMNNKCKQYEEKESSLKMEIEIVQAQLENISHKFPEEKIKEFEDIRRKKDSLESTNVFLTKEAETLKLEFDNLKESLIRKEQEISDQKFEKEKTTECLNKEAEQLKSEIIALKETLVNKEKEINNEKNERENAIKSLKNETETLTSEINNLKDILDKKKQENEKCCKLLMSETEILQLELQKLKEVLTNKEDEINTQKIEKKKISQSLMKEAEILKQELDSLKQILNSKEEQIHSEKLEKENRDQSLMKETEILKLELQELKEALTNKEKKIISDEVEKEKCLKQLEDTNNDIKEKEKQYVEMNKEIVFLKEKVLSLNEEISDKEKKYETEIIVFRGNIHELLAEKEKLINECKNFKNQVENLKEELMTMKLNLEEANRNATVNGQLKNELLEEKLVCKKLEDELKSVKACSKENVLNNNIINSEDEKFNKLMEAKDEAENQVAFLNSVIVDMQRKNEGLLERIQYLENHDPSETLECRKPKFVAPRMFCDICDMFDLHETEDCPRQSNSSPVPLKCDTPKIKPPQRPYCENCEMFGHDTNDCNDDENF